MRMTVLASGSKGNSTVIASAQTRLLIDAGLSCRELLKRMKLANEDPAALDAILITHEHQPHRRTRRPRPPPPHSRLLH